MTSNISRVFELTNNWVLKPAIKGCIIGGTLYAIDMVYKNSTYSPIDPKIQKVCLTSVFAQAVVAHASKFLNRPKYRSTHAHLASGAVSLLMHCSFARFAYLNLSKDGNASALTTTLFASSAASIYVFSNMLKAISKR